MRIFVLSLILKLQCSLSFGQSLIGSSNIISDIERGWNFKVSSIIYKSIEAASLDMNFTKGYFCDSNMLHASTFYRKTIFEATSKRNIKINPWENVNGIRLAAGYFYNLETEVSFIISSLDKTGPCQLCWPKRVQYIGLGFEYLRIGSQNIIGTKLSYENIVDGFLALQMGTDFLLSDKDKQFRLLPKIGLTAFGNITLYYGYNIELMRQSNIKTMPHLVSLQLNFDSEWIKAIREK